MQAAFKDIAERSQKLLAEFAERYQADGPQPVDPLKLTQTFIDFTARMLADPNQLLQAQMELWGQYMKLWQVTAQRMMGQPVEPVAEPAKGDKRFADPAWRDEVGVRLPQAVLPADRALAAGHGQGGRGRRRQDGAEGRVLHAPVHRRDVALQLRHDQPAGA